MRKHRFFTPKQVTTMVVTLILAVALAPAGAGAVEAFSRAVLTDATTGVDTQVVRSPDGGRLHVGDSSGPLTVDGTITAATDKAWDARVTLPVASGARTLRADNTGFAVTSVTVSNPNATPATLYVQRVTPSALDIVFNLRVPAHNTIHLALPSPLFVKPATGTFLTVLSPWAAGRSR